MPAVVAATLLLPHSPSALRELLDGAGPTAPAVALGAWLLLTPALFPGTVMAAAGGLAFGAVGGAALAVAGAVAGGLVTFALARAGARDPVERFVQRTQRLGAIHAVLQRRGFATVLAVRLIPGVPVSALQYVAGAPPVRADVFAAAMAIGALLRTVPYALLGDGLASGSTLAVLVAAGSIAVGAVVATVLARRIRRAALVGV